MTTKVQRQPQQITSNLKKEMWGIALLGSAALLGGGLLSLQAGDGRLMGPFGQLLSLGLYALLGMGSYLVIAALFSIAWGIFTGRFNLKDIRLWIGYTGATITGTILMFLIFPSYRLQGLSAGGKTGEFVGSMGISLFSKAGTFLITGTAMILFLVLATQTSPAKGVISVARFASFIMSSLARGATALGKAIVALFAWENAEGQPPEETQLSSADGSLDTVADEASPLPASQSEINDASEGATESLITEVPGDDAPLESSSPADEITSEDPAGAESAAIPGKGRGKKARGTNTKPMPRQPVSVDPVKAASAARTTKPPVTEPAKSAQNQAPVASPAPTGTVAPAMATIGPRILNMEESDESRLATLKEFRDELGEFVLPDPEILHYEKTQGTGMDPETMINLSSRMVSALADYKISGSVTEIHPGPVVTMYEFVPEAGIRVSKIESLNKDLALSLAATRVRIVAPIPGKSAVGIEVPNKRRQTVYIKEGIADTAFQESKSKLTMVLGKDIKGK
ncbi:DNA translocase FtsK 4TM domain-containing protein, partial [Myxococcota bacterium]|nr:DNA translocase FtsK 4TM domain-containing protein [Myxococcota bacterium]